MDSFEHLMKIVDPLLKYIHDLANNFRDVRNTFPHEAQFQSVLILSSTEARESIDEITNPSLRDPPMEFLELWPKADT